MSGLRRPLPTPPPTPTCTSAPYRDHGNRQRRLGNLRPLWKRQYEPGRWQMCSMRSHSVLFQGVSESGVADNGRCSGAQIHVHLRVTAAALHIQCISRPTLGGRLLHGSGQAQKQACANRVAQPYSHRRFRWSSRGQTSDRYHAYSISPSRRRVCVLSLIRDSPD